MAFLQKKNAAISKSQFAIKECGKILYFEIGIYFEETFKNLNSFIKMRKK